MKLTQKLADDKQWFHGMNLGDVQTNGRVSPNNWSLYPMLRYMESIDFSGLKVLDVGTMDGLVAFIADQEGAREVHATDLYYRETFELAREKLGLATQYHPNTSIESLLNKFGRNTFDVIVMGGLLYHLLSPLRCCLIARHLLKSNGLLLLETVCTRDEEPNLTFNQSKVVIDEYTTYFVPSISAVAGMLHFSLFDVLRIGSIAPLDSSNDYTRTTFLAEALALDEARPKTNLMKRSIERGSRAEQDQILDEFSFAKLDFEKVSPKQSISKKTTVEQFQVREFTSKFALQP